MSEARRHSAPVEQFGSEYMPIDPTVALPKDAAEFQELVKQAPGTPCVLDFEEIKTFGMTNPDKTITQNCVNAIKGALEDAPNGKLYVHSEEMAKDLQGKMQNAYISRTGIAETSAHQVFFGTIAGSAGRVRVAIKPFTNNGKGSGKEAMATEWVNMQLAGERGFGAFAPVGFITTHEGGYLLTERRDDFEPLDNSNWEGALHEPEANKAMLDDLSQVGPLLGRLHDKGGFHGDPQLKNFGVTEEGGVDAIDWEAGKFVEQPVWGENTADRVEYLKGRTERDLKVLFASLARSVADKGVGLLDGFTPVTQWSFFKEYVVTPYLNERMNFIDQTSHPDATEALVHLAEIEEALEAYVCNGEMYDSLRRTRQRILLDA
jgi:hypothetical protein